MVITLTSGLILAACGGAGLFGIGKGVKAYSDSSTADDVNNNAKSMVRSAKRRVDSAREHCSSALEALGKKKMQVYRRPLKRFIENFNQIKNFVYRGSACADERQGCPIDKVSFARLSEQCISASSMVGGAAGGLAAGAAMAFGAYGAVGMLATTATTGTAIAGLSGAAATNATLAWLGGGALGVGGGVAAGTAVLGGIVAGPALAIFGCVLGAQASEKLDKAYSNLAQARKIKEQLSLASEACDAITERAELFLSLLTEAFSLLLEVNKRLELLLAGEGKDFKRYSKEAKNAVYTFLPTIQLVKVLLETPILNAAGKLTGESKRIGLSMKKELEAIKNEPECEYFECVLA